MRREEEDGLQEAQEHERLIQDAPTNDSRHAHALSSPGEVDETVLSSPGKFVWTLTFSAGVCGLLFGYDTGVISSTLVSIGSDLSNRPLSTLDQSLIASCTSLFALLASPLAGLLADALGRKKVILLADVLFTIGAVWQAASVRVVDMIVGRSIVGAAVGIASFVAPMYISELAPSIFRGRMVTIQCLLITFGQVVAYIIGWAFSKQEHGWRYMVGIGALPAIVQMISMFFLPETPRWLIKAGRDEQAMRVLRRAYGGAGRSGITERQRSRLVDHVLQSIASDINNESVARALPGASKSGLKARLDTISHVLVELFTVGSNRRALAIACMLQGAQQLCGFNSLMYFSASIFALVGFRSPTLTALSVATTNFVFTLVAFYSIDRIGRRRILLLSIPFMVAGLVLCALAFGHVNVSPHSGPAVTPQEGLWPKLILVSLVVYVASYATGLGNVPWQQSELFPLSVRSLGSSLATATNWGSNTIIGLTFLPLMDAITPAGTFTLYAFICAICWAIVWYIYPETAGLGLEEVSGLLEDGWAVSKSLELFKARRSKALQEHAQPQRSD